MLVVFLSGRFSRRGYRLIIAAETLADFFDAFSDTLAELRQLFGTK